MCLRDLNHITPTKKEQFCLLEILLFVRNGEARFRRQSGRRLISGLVHAAHRIVVVILLVWPEPSSGSNPTDRSPRSPIASGQGLQRHVLADPAHLRDRGRPMLVPRGG